ncbi:hypothetical protein A6D6_02032 [Alcanivorax xiamenensis]|uniref:PIN domain-containing protein n=1 Tax=Alcanivorax xiamenensis TaxID=1177156 RepID=A0ABQ6Y8U2_9GAMM|nr:DUF4411 family protein [Alcanivorax xiamenensis]KAF0805771.1 hypothetical protein A6D6_02032 [Alcanivorax xiamenensis]
MYLLDANTYIQAKNLHYQMSFCPAYWHWLDEQFEAGQLASISSVYHELTVQNDELTEWVKMRKAHFLPVSSENIQDQFGSVAEYVSGLEDKKAEHIADFLGNADPWLVATACASGATVVTHEAPVPDNSSKVKIPNVCRAFDVPYITTYELLNTLDAQFVLGRSS